MRVIIGVIIIVTCVTCNYSYLNVNISINGIRDTHLVFMYLSNTITRTMTLTILILKRIIKSKVNCVCCNPK